MCTNHNSEMTFEEGLLDILNDDERPLPKRLKIADNAFNSSEVSIKHREIFLLKWLLYTETSDNNHEIWKQCETWMASDSFREIRASDIPYEDYTGLLKKFTEQFKSDDEELLKSMALITSSVIESCIFINFFQANLADYIIFLKNIFSNVSDIDVLLNILSRHQRMFGKRIITIPGFHVIFLEEIFGSFVNILVKFNDKKDTKLFDALSIITQKNVFHKKHEEFKTYFKELWDPEGEYRKFFLETMVEQLPIEGDQLYVYHAYRLMFDAFCKCYQKHPDVSYNLFAFLLHHLGFQCEKFEIPGSSRADFQTALTAIVAMLEVISTNSIKFDENINEISFAKLLKSTLLCIMNTTVVPMNDRCFEIIDLVARIQPMMIVDCLSELVVYLMMAKNEGFTQRYSTTMCNIFEIYQKLRRVYSVVGKIINKLQPYYEEDMERMFVDLDGFSYEGNLTEVQEHIELSKRYIEMDVEKMLPDEVLSKFGEGTATLISQGVSHIFKIFTKALDGLVGEDLVEKSKKDSYVVFMGLVIRLMTYYMTQINIASTHFRKDRILEKNEQHMNETRAILEKLGTALVGIEHNQNLMRLFLQLSYTWGELTILREFHLVNDKEAEKGNIINDPELSTCNISSLHSYLPAQTWCLIAERISNFGEQPCKKIMEKLWVQKIRYLILSGIDTPTANEHIAALIKSISPIEDYYEYLLSNQFASHAILHQMDSKSLVAVADCVVKDALENIDVLKHVIVSRTFVIALLFNIVKKMNKMLKKEAKSKGHKYVSCAVFSDIGENFLEEDIVVKDLNVRETFTIAYEKSKEYKRESFDQNNVEKLRSYLNLLKQLPIVFLGKSSQTLLYYFVLGAFLDVNGSKDENVGNDLENILIGLGQTNVITKENILPTKMMLDIIINNFTNVNVITMFNSTMLLFKSTDYNLLMELMEELVKHLDDDTYMSCLLQLLRFIQRMKGKKKTEIAAKLMTTISQFCETLVNLIDDKKQNVSNCTEILVECLRIVPISDEIAGYLKTYLDIVFTTNNEIAIGELKLLNFALPSEKFKPDDGVEKQVLINNVANALKKTDFKQYTNKSLVGVYASTVKFVLQHLEKIEDVENLLKCLLEKTLTLIDQPDDLAHEIQMWQQLLTTKLPNAKASILMKINEEITFTLYKQAQTVEGEVYEKLMTILIGFNLQLLQSAEILISAINLDLIFATITERMQKTQDFETSYKPCVHLLEAMLRNRQALVFDRIPVFLQAYRWLLGALCDKSNVDNKQFTDQHFEQMAEYAHQLETLTIIMCKMNKKISKVSLYLVADIVKEYETITIYPAVKLSLNNCLNSLLALCSSHAIETLMRSLSHGSTEIFKMVYDNYKKYHRYTGKV